MQERMPLVQDQYDLFRSLEPPVEIIGISQNSVSEHREFKEELQLPFTLLSDPDRMVAESFKVPVHLGAFPAKSSFVIGPTIQFTMSMTGSSGLDSMLQTYYLL